VKVQAPIEKEHLLIIPIVECAIGDSNEGARLLVVGVLAIALEQSQCGNEVPLLQEVVRVWQLQLVLL